MTDTKRRIEKLEQQLAPERQGPPTVIIYDPANPDDAEQKYLEEYNAAIARGWRPDGTTLAVFFLPENGRPHPGRTD